MAHHLHAPARYDVIVVGGGPVGVLAGLALANQGLYVAVLERSVGVYPAPRAVALDDETVRCLGLIDPALFPWIQSHALRCVIDLRVGTPGTAGGGSLVGPMVPQRADVSGGVDETVFVHQPEMERMSRQLFKQRGGVLIEGCSVVSVDDGGECGCVSVSTNVADAAGLTPEVPHRYCARYVIAADGAGSTVRHMLGVPYVGSSSPEPWLVVDVEGLDPDICARWQRFNFMNVADAPGLPFRSVVHVPLPGARGARRFEFQMLATDDQQTLLAAGKAGADAVTALLRETLGVDLTRLTIVRVVSYTFSRRIAASWRIGRILLAGDAAHCMPPFRGQGLCAGIRDVSNLAWKVAAVVAGTAPQSALDSYEAERAPHVTSIAEKASLMGRLITCTRPALIWHARNSIARLLYGCPLTRPLFVASFNPATRFDVGAVGFAAPTLRTSTARDGVITAPSAFQGVSAAWHRDWVVGSLFPNFPILRLLSTSVEAKQPAAACMGTCSSLLPHTLVPGSGGIGEPGTSQDVASVSDVGKVGCMYGDSPNTSNDEDASATIEEPLDAALARIDVIKRRMGTHREHRIVKEHREHDQAGSELLSAPPWLLLLAPHTSSRAMAEHVADLLRPSDNESLAPHDGSLGIPVVVVQLLPAVAGPTRAAAHALWRSECGASGASMDSPTASPRRALPTIQHEAWWPAANIALPDATGRLQLWFDEAAGGADVALLRPDRVIWAACALDDARTVLREASSWGSADRSVRRRAQSVRWLAALVAEAWGGCGKGYGRA